ncbi:MAG: MOSC domain-containing protein [Anaerolineales bacterium]
MNLSVLVHPIAWRGGDMVFQGRLLSIFIRPQPGKTVLETDEVRAVPGKGLEGDYCFAGIDTGGIEPGRELTLIEKETLNALEVENEIHLNPGDSRRNLLTENVPLNHLVGKEFRVGEVTLKGIRLCEPCSHLASLTQESVLPALVHRGGLRAQILSEGIIRVGDPISYSES